MIINEEEGRFALILNGGDLIIAATSYKWSDNKSYLAVYYNNDHLGTAFDNAAKTIAATLPEKEK